MVTLDQAGLARGWTRIVPAPPHLAAFVEFFWAQTAAPPTSRTNGWRIVPDASPHLIVKRLHGAAGDTVGTASATRATVVGARSHHVESDMADRSWTAGVRFIPGTLPLLTRLPACDFADRGVSVENALGGAGNQLVERLADAVDADDAIRILSEAVTARLTSAMPPDWRIRGLIRLAKEGVRGPTPNRPAVRALADEIGVAARTLRQRSADDIGLPPVLVLRVMRLHQALRLALVERTGAGANAGFPGWAAIAGCTGYFDQSHLIRDFRLLLGESPGAFVGRRSIAVSSNRDVCGRCILRDPLQPRSTDRRPA